MTDVNGSAKKRRPDEAGVGGASDKDRLRAILDLLSLEQLKQAVLSSMDQFPQIIDKIRDAANSSTVSRRLMVRNLPFSTTTQQLTDLFSKHGQIADVVVVKDKDGKSKGYGFLTYSDITAVELALRETMDIDGRQVIVKLAAEGNDQHGSHGRDGGPQEKSVKLFIRNLADNTTDDSLRAAFAQYGSIHEAAVMKKQDGSAKGYGFVTFDRIEDACRAAAEPQRVIDGKLCFVNFAQKSQPKDKGGVPNSMMMGGGGMMAAGQPGGMMAGGGMMGMGAAAGLLGGQAFGGGMQPQFAGLHQQQMPMMGAQQHPQMFAQQQPLQTQQQQQQQQFQQQAAGLPSQATAQQLLGGGGAQMGEGRPMPNMGSFM
uniref:RRM domain-containing protein n=1 Tax=Chromera velia CCMP2878 TaxID=1169474 RepID=A0A0G4I651_9ALVE|eukprot:Cvel_11310.t1-p1 / transcript=Cvel_11310.t1 / gene=Cvel_11310 / organism=Chromera_velia_CCMP2878 / gene_product=Polyadenylate-binding protein, cytoplasmic and, putative / transcript_product=Polyadenylate-binding protein, cytoplasmic and, putative / location=Cvel_scaffold707:24150-30010(-) / protein_length=370 / sequence_SO=supercontig / SO=protein_coding / is_pseudo=false